MGLPVVCLVGRHALKLYFLQLLDVIMGSSVCEEDSSSDVEWYVVPMSSRLEYGSMVSKGTGLLGFH